ncbi:ATP-dependent zinc metalloprotease FtsH [Firmicutes bacterium OM04-13BH]|uniref:ATP-dependent zinc metalloprotease FtsH n=2 Tax=Blautia stercoris TaxID=871664 RepID=A0ABR7P820_9FIRM|nr:ATP-dependent zinc metalloprotease FtsH [Blautia stercoris]RGF23293.1 ATP-dependent zinc metalloprotease FtsH [Firmicutes bacterium AM10-47]RHV46098.1 ATP-dependent zinc metalloprotease FtsH [Firmicutes bacterium OM04-13BH]
MTRQFTINNSYSQQDFYESVQNNEVESVYIHPNKEYPTGRVSVDLTNGNSVQFYALDVKEIQDFLGDYSEIALEVGDVPGDNIFLSSVLPIILVAGMAFFLISMMSRQMSGGGGGGTNAKMMNFGKSRARMTVNEENKVTFKDVAGLEEEKEDLEEVVDFLKNPQKYTKVGARIPKGVILVGPPGTGKTLLAKAVAGEAGVPFFSISGSDFVEMFVGVGASRVRDLFEEGKKNAPCIIFIDEIDAVARKRGTGMGGGHDEREQTLNQLLVEMDGFGVNEGIIVMAATNRVDILDPAILRPGRFDRKVGVGRPDIKGREEILKVHVRKKPLGEDVDLHEIARTTAGFTGADLENLMNEAAILTAKDGRYYLTQKDIRQAFVKVGIGAEKKSKVISEKEKKITAYHEAGHAILFHLLPNMGPVHTISIIPTGLGAAGYTMPLPEADEMFNSKNKMLENIVVDLGGRVAEELIFKDVTTGASQDIKQATQLARAMVTQYGMSDKVGLINYGSDEDEVFIGRDLAHTRNYGEQTAAVIDSEVKRIIDEAYSQAKELIGSHIDVLHKCVELLLEKEKIGREEFEALFSENEEQKSLENDLGGTLYDLTKR